MSHGYGQFESNVQWLPENGDRLLDAVVNAFLDEIKDRWHPDKIVVSWDVCVYEVGQEVALASFSCL